MAPAATTGVALITIDANGENEIVVAPGANLELRPEDVDVPDCDGVLCQLEIPLETVRHAAATAPAAFFLNAAPAREPVVPAADVTVVNRYELEALQRRDGMIAVTLGAEGAVLLENGEEVARAAPPDDRARRRHRRRRRLHRMPRRLAARGPGARRGAAARLRRRGARRVAARGAVVAADGGGGRRAPVSIPILIDCDPGHDDAIAILLALASPEVELRAVTTVAGNQTLEKTTRNALKVLELAGRDRRPRRRRGGRAARADAAHRCERARRERPRRAGAP